MQPFTLAEGGRRDCARGRGRERGEKPPMKEDEKGERKGGRGEGERKSLTLVSMRRNTW